MLPALALLFVGGTCRPEPELLELSYPAPRHFPFPPWRIVLETVPRTCNLYGSPRICRDFSSGDHYEPEWMVREVCDALLPSLTAGDCTSSHRFI